MTSEELAKQNDDAFQRSSDDYNFGTAAERAGEESPLVEIPRRYLRDMREDFERVKQFALLMRKGEYGADTVYNVAQIEINRINRILNQKEEEKK